MNAPVTSLHFVLRAAMLAAALLCAPSVHADDWSLQDKNGVRHTLSGLHGRWVLVNFWAPWCPPCIEEMPALDALQKRHKELQVIGVAVMYRSKQEVLDMVRERAVTYPIVLGNEDIASDFGGMRGMPTSFLYSPQGKLIGRHEGPLTQQDVEQAINGSNAAFSN